MRPPSAFGWNRGHPHAKGLVGWWPLSPLTSTANMVGPSSGTFAGVIVANPELGLAFDFDDNADLITVTAYPAITDLTRLTLSVWFTSRSSGGGTAGRLVDKASTGGGWVLLHNGATEIRFEYHKWNPTGGRWSVTAPAFSSGPHHLALSYNADTGTSEVPVVLLDGVAVTVTTATAPAGTLIDADVDNLIISNRSPANRNWDGNVGDVRVYNYPMSLAEMWSLWDPSTRWSLYGVKRRVSLDHMAAAAGGTSLLVRLQSEGLFVNNGGFAA